MAKKATRSGGKLSAGTSGLKNDGTFQIWMIIPLILNPILMINTIDSIGFSGVIVWCILATTALFFTIKAPWTLLAANPLYIINGVHTVDFYIKAIYIATTFALTYFFTKSPKKSGSPFSLNIPEFFWIIYMIWGLASLSWSLNPTLGFERWSYLLAYGVGAYVLGKETKFWKSSAFWNTYVTTAFVVGLISWLMYFLGTEATMDKGFSKITFRQFISFDWIMSAGRPSSTLAYRAYMGTYLVTALPFLLWFMFSKHIKSQKHFIFAAATFILTFVSMFQIRARSAWIGTAASFAAMGLIFLLTKRWNHIRYKPHTAVTFVLCIVFSLLPANQELLDKDTNPQKLKGTSKEEVVNAVTSIGNFAKVGQNDRFDFWSMSKRMLFEKSSRGKYEHPSGGPAWIYGLGLNQFPLYVPMYANILHNLGAEIHNDWIQSFVELGPIGFLGWNGFMFALLYYALRDSRKNSLMVASVGGILGWVFATQTDFATARVYAAVWIGGMAAIICGEAEAAPLFTIKKMFWTPVFRYIAGIYFVWHAFSWGITMWVDRQVYIMLTKGEPVDLTTERIFNSSNWNAYQHGIGKYLIFSPISDMSRALTMQIDKYQAEGNMQAAKPLLDQQKKVVQQLLVMHPTSYAFYGNMADMSYRQGNTKEALDYTLKFLELKPDDWNTFLYCSQLQLDLKDSIGAATSIYKAYQLSPQQGLVHEFWQNRISPAVRLEVIKKMEAQELPQKQVLQP